MKSTGFVLAVLDFVLAVVAAGVVGCGDDNPIGSGLGPVHHSTSSLMDRLGEQRALWEALGLEDYTYGVRRVCLCPFREGVRATVVDGAVAGATDLVTGEVLEPNEVQWYLTIDGLFDLVQDAYDRNAHDVQVEFDASRGYPTRIFIDYSEMIADEELGFTLLSEVRASEG